MTKSVEDPRIHSFGVALEAMSRLQRVFDKSLKDQVGLAASEFEALLRLERSGGHLPMGELAGQLALTSGGVTRMVDRLVKRGLVCREACPEDRRVLYAAITEDGRRCLVDAVEPHLEDLSREFTDRMSAEELAVLTTVMDRLREPIA